MRGVLDRVGVVVGILVGLGAIVAGAWKTVRKLGRFLDDWFGEPGQPGVMARLASLETGQATLADGQAALQGEVAEIKAELHPDSGRTFRDAVDRAVAAAAASKGERS